jgi:hypothetical protein
MNCGCNCNSDVKQFRDILYYLAMYTKTPSEQEIKSLLINYNSNISNFEL